mgnify:CR=1 FL=1
MNDLLFMISMTIVIMGLIIVLKDNHNPLKSYRDNNMLILISTFAVLVAIFTRMTFEMP